METGFRKKGFREFGALIVASFVLLVLYLKLYKWESVHIALTAYEPSKAVLPENLTAATLDLRQQAQQKIRASQQRLLQSQQSEAAKCPDWYTVIRDDFKPWNDRQGITPTALAKAWPLAHFRFQIVDGQLYVERNWQVMHFRYMEYLRFYFSVWGILQLLRRYPGQVPDVDVMMQTFDAPLVDKYQWEADLDPPALLKYCSTPNHWDIAWPDWSFWGWAEIAIPPWQLQLDAIVQTNKTEWERRPSHAFWQGGSLAAPGRQELWRCEDNEKLRWGIELRNVNWMEPRSSMDHKLLENQCRHKYKLYMEGWAWSASAKYIIACDATTLMVESEWFEFWYRGLKPGINFLPVSKAPDLCVNIRRVVDWARTHPKQAKQIGRKGTELMTEEVNMPLVYDYMLHVLREYASLQTFKVRPSQHAFKVDAKTWVLRAFDERNSDAKLPKGFREWEEPRPGIPPEEVRAQLLVEEPSHRPPCYVDWEQPQRPLFDPRDTVGSIPKTLRKEFEELAVLEKKRAREELEEREREQEAWLRRAPDSGNGQLLWGKGVGALEGESGLQLERERWLGRGTETQRSDSGKKRGDAALTSKLIATVALINRTTVPLRKETGDQAWRSVGLKKVEGANIKDDQPSLKKVSSQKGRVAVLEP